MGKKRLRRELHEVREYAIALEVLINTCQGSILDLYKKLEGEGRKISQLESRLNANDTNWSTLSSRVGKLEGEGKTVDIASIKESLDRIDNVLEKHGIAWNTVLREG